MPGQIRKGFFFYFGLFVLLLIAIFCICLVVMMFNPGKTVLWMQYFTSNSTISVEKTTDETQATISLKNLEKLTINCSNYANVKVQRAKHNNFVKDGIYIVNNAKGFTGASSAVPFKYEATLVGNALTLDITEPTGFIYFSRDFEVVLAAYTEGNYDFSNLDLTINTNSGDTCVGVSMPTSEDVKLSALDISSKSGDIQLGNNFDPSNLSKLSLKSDEGKINSFRKVTSNSKSGFGVIVTNSCNVKMETVKGTIDFDVLDFGTNNLNILSQKGNVGVNYIKAANTLVTCSQGNYKFDTIEGNLDFGSSENIMVAPNIVVNDQLTGDFRLSVASDINAEPSIFIKKIGGDVAVISDRGELDIDEANGAISVKSDNDLNVDIIVGENNNSTVGIINNKGNIKLGFLGKIKDVSAETKTGEIFANVTSAAKFVANSYLNDGNLTKLEDGKINVSHGFVDNNLISGEVKNPLEVNASLTGDIGSVKIVTNNKVNFELVTKASLAA